MAEPHAEHADRTVQDYAFWWHARQRMVELVNDPTETPERRRAFAVRQKNYERMMAEYRAKYPEPSIDEILANKPIISTPEQIRDGLAKQVEQIRKEHGL